MSLIITIHTNEGIIMASSIGEVIGTEKCYKRTVNLYKEILQSPTAGFSIGAPVTYTVEEIPDA